jgi:ABC-2 type transport system permease protein
MIKLAINELYRLFLSPLAWVILALSQILIAYLFLTNIDYFIQIQARIAAIPGAPGLTEMIAIPTLNNAATILLLITPLITMRLIAEERRNQSLPLLLSSPLSITRLVLGKYLGSLGFFYSNCFYHFIDACFIGNGCTYRLPTRRCSTVRLTAATSQFQCYWFISILINSTTRYRRNKHLYQLVFIMDY